MTDTDEAWRKAVDNLLADSPPEADARLLQRVLEGDEQQAEDVLNALKIERALDTIGLQQAPRSLHNRLHTIPTYRGWRQRPLLPWGFGLAAAVLVAVWVSVVPEQREPSAWEREPSAWEREPSAWKREPSAREIARAREELMIAFKYLSRAGEQSRVRVEQTISGGMKTAVVRGVLRDAPEVTEEL